MLQNLRIFMGIVCHWAMYSVNWIVNVKRECDTDERGRDGVMSEIRTRPGF